MPRKGAKGAKKFFCDFCAFLRLNQSAQDAAVLVLVY
jgi:hypothetical protein